MINPLSKDKLLDFLWMYKGELYQSKPYFLKDSYINSTYDLTARTFPNQEIVLLASRMGGFVERDKGGCIASSSAGEIAERSFIAVRSENEEEIKLGVDLIGHGIYIWNQNYVSDGLKLAQTLETTTETNFAVFSWNKHKMNIHNSAGNLLEEREGVAKEYKRGEKEGWAKEKRNVILGNLQIAGRKRTLLSPIVQPYSEYLAEQEKRNVELPPNEKKKLPFRLFYDQIDQVTTEREIPREELIKNMPIINKFYRKIEPYLSTCQNRKTVCRVCAQMAKIAAHPHRTLERKLQLIEKVIDNLVIKQLQED